MATSIPPPYAASPLPAHAKVLPAHSKDATQKRRLAAALEMAAGLQQRSLVLALDDGAKPLDERPHGRICQDKSCTQTKTPTHTTTHTHTLTHTHTHTHTHTPTHTHTHMHVHMHACMHTQPHTSRQQAGMKDAETSSTCPEGFQPSCTHLCARVHICKQPRSLYRVPECERL